MAKFERAIESARSSKDQQGIDALRQAIDLYRDDFVEDRYYDWAEPESRRLRNQYLGALLLLTKRLAASGDFVGSLDPVDRGLALEPISEAFHGWAMMIYAAQDRRDAVVAQYRKLQKRLAAERMEASDELGALVKGLLAQRQNAHTPGRKRSRRPSPRQPNVDCVNWGR